jgi:hypothetical protein
MRSAGSPAIEYTVCNPLARVGGISAANEEEKT